MRPYWQPEPGGPPPPHPGRAVKLPVGVVRWTNPTPTLTVIVKLTLSYGPGAELSDGAIWAEPISPQPPLSASRYDGDPALGKLVYPSDFVPFKKRADILVRGHAYAHSAPRSALAERTAIRAGFSVDELSREITVVAAGGTDRIPLTPEHIRDERDAAVADPVGPIASPLVVAPKRWHPLDFDYTAYQAASTLQRPVTIEPDAIIVLRRLSPRAEEVTVLLPNIVPRVFVDLPGSNEKAELEMDCDTLFIDTGAETCTLVFRGDLTVESIETPRRRRMAVSLEYKPDERDMEEILRERPRGLFYYAVEPEDVLPDAPPVPETSELQMARDETWGYHLPPLPSMPLSQYSRVSAELAEGRESRPDVLRKHGIDEEDWSLEERAWPAILTQYGAQNGAAFAKEAGRVAVAAQDALASPDEEAQTLADYARVTVLVERLGTSKGLAQAKMSLPAWLRMKRRFRARTANNKQAKAELKKLIAAERTLAGLALPQAEKG